MSTQWILDDESKRILRSLVERPARIPAIADRLDLDRRLVRRRCDLMAGLGLVTMEVRKSGAAGRPGYLVRISDEGLDHVHGRALAS